MNLKRLRETRSLLEEALQMPASERDAFLEAISDPEIRRNVEELLAVSSEKTDLFDRVRFLPRNSFEPLPPAIEIPGYTVIRELGRGGMGTVYLATDEKHGRPVALKVLSPGSVRLSDREHLILARFSDPHIAQLFDSGATPEGVRYVAMEYVEGMPLMAYAKEHCPTVASRLDLFLKIASAVAYAHQNLVVHRDLKPGNILVKEGGKPKLLDFGIAKLLSEEGPEAAPTELRDRPFTAAFASPEQVAGESTATPSDIYSLGVLLCFLLTGRLPYEVKGSFELPWAVRNLEPTRPSDLVLEDSDANGDLPRGAAVPESSRRLRKALRGDLDAVILKALRKKPSERYTTVPELAEDIRRYLRHEPVSARRGTRRYRAAKFVERHRIGVAAGAALALLFSGAVAAFLLQYQATVRERDKARKEALRKEAVADFLIKMFKLPPAPADYRSPTTATQVLDEAMIELDNAPPRDPELRGTLRYALGKAYLNLGLYTPAERLLAPALADLEETWRDDPAQMAEILFDLARISYSHARYAEAEAFAKRALEIQETAGSSTVAVRSLLGQSAFARGDFQEAERRFREVLRRTSADGTLPLPTAGAMNNLAAVFWEQGNLGRARALFERSLAIRLRHLGENHPDVGQSLYNLARVAEEEGRLSAAEDLFRRAHTLRNTLPDYHPARSVVLQGLGSFLIDRTSYDEAALRLRDSLTDRRAILPDGHPDLARSTGELARLAHALGRPEEAEVSYRASFVQFDDRFSHNHPDRLVLLNNFAALWAEEGKIGKAEATWQALAARRASGRSRPSLNRAIAENLALLAAEGGSKRRRYRTVGMAGLDLFDLGRPGQDAAFSGRPAAFPRPTKILFADDFDDGSINPGKWEYGGSTVSEEDDELRVSVDARDSGGWVRTLPIIIDPSLPVTVTRRAKLHPGNEYFDGSLYFNVVGYPGRRFGVSYANYYNIIGGEVVTVGISIFRAGSNSHRFADRRAHASGLLPPIWDRWFTEELRYDPRIGDVRYAIDGKLRLAYNVGPLPPGARSINLEVSAWGWYTGHYHYLDYLRMEQ